MWEFGKLTNPYPDVNPNVGKVLDAARVAGEKLRVVFGRERRACRWATYETTQ